MTASVPGPLLALRFANMDNPPLAAPRALRQFDDLPGPRAVPVFGNLLQIESTRLHQQLEGWCEQYGTVFKLKLGPRRAIVVGDHELIDQALRDRPDGFRRTAKLEQVWTEMGLFSGVFTANGEVWRRQRRMVMAGFDPAHVKRFYPSLQRVAARLVQRWQLRASNCQCPVAVQSMDGPCGGWAVLRPSSKETAIHKGQQREVA